MDTSKSQTNLVGLVHTQFWFLCASYLPSPPSHSGWVLLFFQVLCSCFVLPVAAWACRALQGEISAGVAVIPASDALILRDTKWVMKMQVLFKHLSFVHSSDRPQMGWSLCNCSPASCAVHKSWALPLFIDFVYTSPLSTHLALSYVQKTVQVTYYSPKGTWDPVLGLMSANRVVELGGWGWVRLLVCQWVGSGSWQSCTSVPAVFLEICSIKGLICCSDWPTDAGWLCPHNSFALWAKCSSQRTERVSESEQKYHMEAPLSQLGQCWLPATAPPVPKTLQCC